MPHFKANDLNNIFKIVNFVSNNIAESKSKFIKKTKASHVQVEESNFRS